VGHRSTAVTELVYRKQIRPVLQSGATAMDRIFAVRTRACLPMIRRRVPLNRVHGA
jgi:hypothetical protein